MTNVIKEHILKLAGEDTRQDGRDFKEYRQPLTVEAGVIKTAEGSARVVMGETEVLAGVKVEIMTPYPDQPDSGSIMVGAELLPLSNPNFEPGPPGIEAIELARVVDRGIRESKAIDFKSLCIEEREKVWMLIVDVCTINADGNLFDAAALAAIVALKDMKFPKYENDKIEYKEKTDKGITFNGVPISVTVHKVGEKLLIDPTVEEEKSSDGRLTVATLEDGTLCAMQKGGDIPLSPEDIEAMVDLASEKAGELRKLIPK